jgi:serine/threonine-protein kinase
MLKAGEPFDRYTIEATVGQGGMGRVYRAYDARLGRRVAIKVISDASFGAEGDARLVREARAAAALDHPNAVAIFDAGELDGVPYIVMELVAGRTLRSAIGGDMPALPTRIGWLADVARALAAAHRRGLVHRDIKPENVMVRDDGVVKVLDFGIARRAGGHADPSASTEDAALPTLTADGVKLGTPVYMAPEQIRGELLDGRADQFAWGVLAFELMTGRLPWRGAGDVLAVVASILTDDVDRGALDQAAVPLHVQEVLLRALAKRPANRFPSMDELLRALEDAAKADAPDGTRPGPAEPLPEPQGSADAASSATLAQRYSTEDVREVLSRAIEEQASKGAAKLSFDDLLAVAREVGVDADTLRKANRTIRVREQERLAGSTDAAERDAWIRRRRWELYRHAGVYVIVLPALVALAVLFTGAAYLPYLGALALLWGIGLGIHALIALTANEGDWAEEKQGLKWWNDQQRRRHELRMAQAASRLATSRHDGDPAPRLETTSEPPQQRVRFALDTAREQAAEQEADLAAPREVKRRQP